MTTATLAAPRPAILSPKQLSLFWRLFARAWSRHAYLAELHHLDTAAKEAWRHEILQKHGRVTSIKLLRDFGFERVMLELATEADDRKQIGYWTSCVERRYRHLIQQTLQDCARIDPDTEYNWEYVRSTYVQSRQLPHSIFETPADTLRKVFQMLDTHRRRLNRRRLEQLEEAPF